MIGVRLTNCGPTVGEPDIAAFELRVGVRLPDGYRRFLLEVNGGDGPDDGSGYPPDSYFSLHWLGGPVSDEDIAAACADRSWWEFYDRRDLEFGARGHWSDGLSRAWLPVGAADHEDLVLIRLEDGSVWAMDLVTGVGFDEDACRRVAGSFDELGLRRA
jgi:hypothetical protein